AQRPLLRPLRRALRHLARGGQDRRAARLPDLACQGIGRHRLAGLQARVRRGRQCEERAGLQGAAASLHRDNDDVHPKRHRAGRRRPCHDLAHGRQRGRQVDDLAHDLHGRDPGPDRLLRPRR
ncbi:hypothetical protein LTR53_019843, partial [Teratosphaeriaceae sp. CCFEE 6253]